MNFKSLTGLELFYDIDGLSNYTDADITTCIWPNYNPQVNQCLPQLPTFVLNNMYSVRVGSNVTDNYSYVPFEHCQNSRFLIRICANDPTIDGSCISAGWIAANQTTASINILSINISSVGVYNIWLQAQLLISLSKISDLAKYITTSIMSFEFVNNNCEIISIPPSQFIIVNQTKTFDVSFRDFESDNVIMNFVDSAGLGVFINALNNLNFQIYLNCNNDSIKTADLIFSYTDTYHMNASYLQTFNVSINVFVSEPPIFAESIQSITVNLCSPSLATQKLPSIIDSDSNLFTISFAELTPNWIYISSNKTSGSANNYICIDCVTNNCQRNSDNMLFTIILSDDTGAWTQYQFYVEFVSQSIQFNHIDDVSINMSKAFQIPVNIGNVQLYASECKTNSIIDWICYIPNQNDVFVFDQAKCGFNLDPCNISKYVGSYCVQLFATDNCNNIIVSNEFTVGISPYYPAAIANAFGPIKVYQNYYFEVEIPKLFYDVNSESFNYSSTYCINGNNIIATRIDTKSSTNIQSLFVKAYGNRGCNITIVDNNSYCQSSEVVVSVQVLSCSSKVCIECKGPSDADCIKCEQGYALDTSGSCLADNSFIPNTDSIFYTVCGIIAMTTTILHIILAFIYGKSMLEIVVYLQTVIMLSLSSNTVSSARLTYLSWLQIFKFDFGFINPIINPSWTCSRSTGILLNVKLYCEDTLHNYFVVFCVLLLLFCINALISRVQKCKRLKNSIIIKSISMNLIWTFINIVCPFMIINMCIDLMTISHHFICSLFTICIIVICCMYCMKTKLNFLTPYFITKLDQLNVPVYTYIQLITKIECILIFLSNSNFILLLLLMTYIIMIFMQIKHEIKLSLLKSFSKAGLLLGNSIMLIVIMLISAEKITEHSSIEQTGANLNLNGNTVDRMIALLFTTLCLSLIINAIVIVIISMIL